MFIFDQEYEKKCAPLMERCKVVLEAAIKAAGVPLDQIDSVEIVGGHSARKNWVEGCVLWCRILKS